MLNDALKVEHLPRRIVLASGVHVLPRRLRRCPPIEVCPVYNLRGLCEQDGVTGGIQSLINQRSTLSVAWLGTVFYKVICASSLRPQ